jgi:hypothetical protein
MICTWMLCLFNFPAYVDCNVGFQIPSSKATASHSLSTVEAETDSSPHGVCPNERDPAECVRSVRRHWLHQHPVVASLQQLQLSALSLLEPLQADAREFLAAAAQCHPQGAYHCLLPCPCLAEGLDQHSHAPASGTSFELCSMSD